MKIFARRGKRPLLWLMVLLCAAGGPAPAETHSVTRNGDSGPAFDAGPTGSAGAGTCGGFAFPYTLTGTSNAARIAELRQAIDCANANATDDQIDLGGNTLTLGDAPYTDANGVNALPFVTGTLTLRNGALQRGASAPAFRFLDVAASGILSLRAMQLRNGKSPTEGGAIRAEGVLAVEDCVFEDNVASTFGGALSSHARTDITASRFTRNAAPDGAAIAGDDSNSAAGGEVTAVMISRFEDNGAADSRSVIWNKSYFAMIGSLVAGNHLAAAGSSLLYIHQDTAVAELRAVTIAGNSVQGALFAWSSANVQVFNSIIWDNQYGSLGGVSPRHSIVPGCGAVVLDGCLDQPPGFVGPNDYHLDAGSPAIDAGDNSYGWTGPDLDGNPRQLDDTGVTDTGHGPGPIIDMGAYEYQANSVAAGITVTPTSGLITTETGGTATFSIVFARYPKADVTLALSSSDATEGVVVPTSLTITQANWNRPHTITVTGLDDGISDGDQAYTIAIAPASSADPAYAGIDPPNVSVVNKEAAIPPHHVGGTVIGLLGNGLVLSLGAGAETLPVSANGSFAFTTALAPGAVYAVTVATHPQVPAQSCAVINGSGTMGAADVGNVVVNCGASNTRTIGGTVSGLGGGGLTLQLNGGGDRIVSVNGSYAFASRLVDGANYVVTVKTQPQGQWCTLAHASGTVQGANVTNVDASCAPLAAELYLDVDDGREYARYGHVRDYFVTLGNTGNVAANGVAVAGTFSAAFDAANVRWQCLGGANLCGTAGAGGFSDTANLPPNSSVTWLVSVPVLGGSDATEATFAVNLASPPPAGSGVSGADTDTLVIFRDGVDVPYGDGARPAELTQRLDEHSVPVEWLPAGGDGIHVVLVLQTPDGEVEVQRLTYRGADYVRLLGTDRAGQQRASDWAPVADGARLIAGRVAGAADTSIVLLDGAQRPLALPQQASQINGEVQ
ncbi:choice-of-anchor Q domain-containing protein [Tahibacter sp. UC22_41]|uniref:choice-of-anchor Q domain-containing protein n=1 Tax=Tahibacter sp. UC22_41 TaxID=3350178 RepID=UPI0036DB5CE2